MKQQDKYDILSTLVDGATFLCYGRKVVNYNRLLQRKACVLTTTSRAEL